MKMYDQITEIFCNVNDFCLDFEKKYSYPHDRKREEEKNIPFSMLDSEVITILIYFHLGSFRNFMYILIENYTTFPLKSIPLIEVKPVALQIQQQHKNDDKHGYKTRDYQTVLPGV